MNVVWIGNLCCDATTKRVLGSYESPRHSDFGYTASVSDYGEIGRFGDTEGAKAAVEKALTENELESLIESRLRERNIQRDLEEAKRNLETMQCAKRETNGACGAQTSPPTVIPQHLVEYFNECVNAPPKHDDIRAIIREELAAAKPKRFWKS